MSGSDERTDEGSTRRFSGIVGLDRDHVAHDATGRGLSGRSPRGTAVDPLISRDVRGCVRIPEDQRENKSGVGPVRVRWAYLNARIKRPGARAHTGAPWAVEREDSAPRAWR